MTKTAVILAAGIGSRLETVTNGSPKGFIQIDGIPLIELSIKKLIEAGIAEIFIGTGFASEYYHDLATKYKQVKCVFNPNYENSGSMETLFRLSKYIQEQSFLLLESDLLYEKKGLEIVIEHRESNVILASDCTHTHDEVFIETNRSNELVKLSKVKTELNMIKGELIGIVKLTKSTVNKMTQYYQSHPNQEQLNYEDVLTVIAKSEKVYVKKITPFLWCEIDDQVHLKRAKEIIYPLIKNRELERNILLTPGPATTSTRVKIAQLIPDLCPREEEFSELLTKLNKKITSIVANKDDYSTVFFSGSGTAAVESIVSSVIGDGCLLIVNNGAYGKRMCEIAKAFEIDFLEYKSPIDEPINIDVLGQFIKKQQKLITHLALVHHETTTGLLNELQPIAKLCKHYHLQFIVDAMSSFAAVPINMKQLNIDYLAASSNKNLQALPGVSFVISSNENLANPLAIEPKNYYLNLYRQYLFLNIKKQMPFTAPVQTIYALKEAVDELFDEGIEQRYHRYAELWEILNKEMKKLGFSHLVKEEHHGKLITAFFDLNCKEFQFKHMHDYFYKLGYTIYPGKLEAQKTFRIANIGDLSRSDIELFLRLLKQYLNEIGCSQCE